MHKCSAILRTDVPLVQAAERTPKPPLDILARTKSHHISEFERREGMLSVIYHTTHITATIDNQHGTNHCSEWGSTAGKEIVTERHFESSARKEEKKKLARSCLNFTRK